MSANEHIEELLSGFLDGELTAEELREFELAMSVDATLKIKLEQLRQLGNDLRCVPKRTLGSDFADRVLAAARQKEMVEFPAVAQPRNSGSWWQMVGVVVALAAVLLFGFFVVDRFSVSGDELVQVPPVETPADHMASNDGMASNDAMASNDSMASNDAVIKDSTPVRNDPGMRRRVASQSEYTVLTIMEIEPSTKAWKENEIAKILSDAGILWANPVRVSDEVIGVLNETRSISQALPKSGSEQLALVMVTANGRLMDRALRKILESVDTFPHVLMDIAFDLPGKDLCQKLVDAQVAVADGQQAIATPIVAGTAAAASVGNTGLDSVSQFSSAPPAKYLAPSLRQAMHSGDMSAQVGKGIGAEEEDATSYVLLVIRQPAK